MKKLYFVLVFAILISCKKEYSNKFSNVEYDNKEVDEEFSDGEYCAEIQYYNPNSGKRSTYTLPVEVENGELVKIQWENGGWLDESHFTAPDISNGTASFEDDRGREYEVELKEKGNNCSSNYSNFEKDDDEDEEDDDEQNENN